MRVYVGAHFLNYTEYMNVDTISTRRKNIAVVMIWKVVVSKKKKNRDFASLGHLKGDKRRSQNKEGLSEADKAKQLSS